MAIFLARVVERAGIALPDGSDQGFVDLDEILDSARLAINQIKQLGITAGTSATTFGPENAVRRDEMGTFLARTMEMLIAGSAAQ